ncbi:MAG: SMP-30/gluconolactonase/LRE family protein [Chloroflexota bacterium]|nr:SMP-30/gluconolactonase/LRE family protein [Chloroflexota bacterium]MED6296032.1 SMP-30/gluconolactonase/LRE family protein [Chloroflexota bacterium]|tara:strand:+ start:1663 stop:2559 length:897 start_codon:yes stop_codon:yes gene_type:complete
MSWDFIAVQGPFGGTSEGPAWDGEFLLFTHIPDSKIYKFDPKTSTTQVFRENTNCANGLMFDADGKLYACEGGGRRVVRYDGDSTTVLADSYQGSKFNVPNDLAIDPEGRVWFTDPFYEGAGGAWSEDRSNKELDHDSVYRIDLKDGKSTAVTRVTEDTTRPNGLLFSLDFKTLYVAQSGRLEDEKRQLRAYPVNSDGSLGPHEVIHDFGEHRGIDGMVLDVEGNIIATAGYKAGGPGPMIYVFSASGEVLETHPTPFDRPTNCSFGGEDLSTLYVTTIDGFLLRAFTERQGRLAYPH